ncbi:MAG: hydratase [Caulobacteraceae bacterium]
MTERRRSKLSRSAHALQIGPSRLNWQGGALTAEFDEITAPLPSRLRGTIRLQPQAVLSETFALDAAQRHHWRPIAPRCTVDVTLSEPDCAWRGQGYFDTNAGEAPLEDGFCAWNWSRAHLQDESLLFYDVEGRDGERAHVALRVDAAGGVELVAPPPPVNLASTAWRMPRLVRSEPPPRLVRTLEDTPFYTRSLVQAGEGRRRAVILHESLSLDRLRSPMIRAMLPFRMPRVFW